MTNPVYDESCPVSVILKIIGGKWKSFIVHVLLDGTKRFNELKRIIPGVTQQILTNQLRELEADKIITRKVYAEIPPRVEYSLTKQGYALKPILDELRTMGECYMLKLQQEDEDKR